MNGHIKLHRKMLSWGWYDDINTKVLFLHCLLKANWKKTEWHGVSIDAGQFVTSLASLAKETRLSVRQVRVALDHLTMTGELTSKACNKYRIITVNNWFEYQLNDKQDDKQMTSRRQADDKQMTTDEEIKESKKEINNKRFVPPTVDEVRTYINEKSLNVDPERFVDFYESKGWMVGKNKMKDWKAAARNWSSKDKSVKPTSQNKFNNFESRSIDFDALNKLAFGE